MADLHSNKPSNEDLSNQQSDQEEELKKQNDSQLVAFQMFGGGIIAGALYGRQVKNFLNEPLDINKFIANPTYRKQIHDMAKSTDFWGGLFGKKEWTERVKQVEAAKKIADKAKIGEQLVDFKKGFLNRYNTELQSVYGLNPEQITDVTVNALKRIEENPELTVSEAVRLEARNEVGKKISKEVDSDKSIAKKDRKEERQKRLDKLDNSFSSNTQASLNRNAEETVAREKIRPVKQEILKESGSLFEDKQPAPSRPAPIPEPVVSSPTPSSSSPATSPPATPRLPTTSAGGGSGIRNFFSGLKGGLKGIFSGIKDGIKNLVGLIKNGLTLLKRLIGGGVPLLLDLGKKILGKISEWIGLKLLGLNKFFEQLFSPENITKIAFKIVLAIVLILLVIMLTGSNNTNLAAPGTSLYNMQ